MATLWWLLIAPIPLIVAVYYTIKFIRFVVTPDTHRTSVRPPPEA